MSFHLFLLTHIPSVLLGFLIIFLYVSLSIAGFLIVRKYYPYHRCKNHNDIAGFIFATLGVIYAVILAFTVVVTWGDYDKADEVASREANCIASLFQDATAFPHETRTRIQADLADYVKAIVHEEWPKMDRGYQSQNAVEIQNKLWAAYMGIRPAGEAQKIFLNESVKNLNLAGELRRQRLHYASTGIHPVLYAILFIGSVITIAFTMIFGTQNTTEHLIMTSCLAAMIGLTIYTIVVLDYPFSGYYSVSPDDLMNILPTFKL